MIGTLYEEVALIDTSAVVALHDPTDEFHRDALEFWLSGLHSLLAVMDATSHECYTVARYSGTFQSAIEHYHFVRQDDIRLLRFASDDEAEAESILQRYRDHDLSFHDALCAAVMKRHGIYKVFTFDSHFSVMGFYVLPGRTQSGRAR